MNLNVFGNSFVGYDYELVDNFAGRSGTAGSTVRIYTNRPALSQFKTNAASPAFAQLLLTADNGANLAVVVASKNGYGTWKTNTVGSVGNTGTNTQTGLITVRLPSRAIWWVTNTTGIGSGTITNFTLTP